MIINKFKCDIVGCEHRVEVEYTPTQTKDFEDEGWNFVTVGDPRYGSILDSLHFCPDHNLKNYERRSISDGNPS